MCSPCKSTTGSVVEVLVDCPVSHLFLPEAGVRVSDDWETRCLGHLFDFLREVVEGKQADVRDAVAGRESGTGDVDSREVLLSHESSNATVVGPWKHQAISGEKLSEGSAF